MAPSSERSLTGSRRRWLRILAVTTAAAAATVGAFTLGRVTAPTTANDTTGKDCDRIRTSVNRELPTVPIDEATTEAERNEAALGLRTASNLVLQNAGCFSPDMRANAQTALDRLDQGAERDALACAEATGTDTLLHC